MLSTYGWAWCERVVRAQRETEAGDAGDAGTHTTAIAGTGNAAAGSNPDVAQPALPVHTPGWG